jgi:hypothetical protein
MRLQTIYIKKTNKKKKQYRNNNDKNQNDK